MNKRKTVAANMKHIHPFLLLFCLTFLISLSVQAENPPYVNVLADPIAVGDSIEFTVTTDTTAPDCGVFFFNCETNNAGIDNLEIRWTIYEISDCAGCDLGGTEVASGTLDYGFWGNNCNSGSTTEGSSCTDPGGCDRKFKLDSDLFCPSATYEIVTYGFNVDYTKGVADDSDQGPGPWRCCDGDPDLGNLENMEDCTLPANGGTGGGWLNPSYPQSFTFSAPGDAPAPTLSTVNTLSDGDTLICGEDITTDITITPNSTCPPTKVMYTLLLNGNVVKQDTSDCVEVAQTFNHTATIIGCPFDPNCDIADETTWNALCSNFGTNTLRWEARQDCDDAIIAFEEITFTLDCADADDLVIETDDQFLCVGESGTVEVNNPSNVNIPYTGGTYELHWNNANPYNSPSTNYLGTGQTATLTNDGTYPTNTPIVISGTIWETYDTSAPEGCEVFSTTAEFIMLTAVTATDNVGACDFGQINIIGGGGLPAYDNTAAYTYDAASAGAGTNSTGLFATLENSSDPIPEGTYTIGVTDGEGCSVDIDVEVYNAIAITQTPSTCADFNTFTINVTGGQPDHPNHQDLTQYTVFSDIDGFLGNPDANGDFTATGLTAGVHTLTLEYEHQENGAGSGSFCSNTIDVEVYDNFDITLSTDFCDFVNGVGIATITGGRDPAIADFAGAAYTVFLSTTAAPSAANDVTSNEGTLTGAGNFTGVAAGDYFAVVEDDRGCQFSVAVTVNDLGEFTLTEETAACAANTITMESTGGNPNWTYWLYTLNAPFDDGASDLTNPTTSTTSSPGVYTGSFTGIFVGQYTVYGQDADGCVTLAENVNVLDEVDVTQDEADCDDFNTVSVTGTGGYAGAPYIAGIDFLYTLIDTDGTTVLESNNSGTFTGYDAGVYTIDASDNNPNTDPCVETISVEIYDTWDVTYSTDPCVGANSIEITSVTGGRDPAVAGFTGAQYNIILTTSATSTTPALDTNNNPLSFTTSDPSNDIPFTFDNLDSDTEYYIVVTDGTSDADGACSYVVGPIDLSAPIELEVTPNTCATFNTVEAEVIGGAATNDFYIYPLGAPLQGAPNPPNTNYNPTAATNGAVDDTNNNPLALTDVGVANFTNVPAGSYTVYAVDGNGCQVTSADIEVYEPFDIEFDGDACSFFNEIPLADVLGGRDPALGFSGAAYSIFLSTTPAPGATNDVATNEGVLTDAGTFTGISSGTYFVILEDDRGCQYSEGVSIDEAAIMTATETNCETTPGTAQATITGGGVPDWTFYLYSSTGTFDAADPENATNGWTATDAGDGTGNDTTGDFSGIAGGAYTIYALDQSGCQPTSSVEVEIYDAFNLDITADDCGSGEVVINSVTGGQDPAIFADGSYEIFLSTEPAPNGVLNVFSNELTLSGAGTFTGVPDGTFYVIVEDGNGCQFGTLFSMDELITLSQQGGDCEAGALDILATNGAADWDFYVYTTTGTFDANDPENSSNGWIASDVGDGTGNDNLGEFTGLAEGDYVVYGVDQNGCERSLSVSIFAELAVNVITDTCDYGDIIVEASGGNPSFYTFGLINSNQGLEGTSNTGIFNDLDFDTYSVIVSDVTGCTASVTGIVVNTEDIALTPESTCADGYTATGGAGNFSYSIYTIPDGDLITTNTTGDFSDQPEGTYTMIVTDGNNCTYEQIIACIGDPCDLAATASTECIDLENFNVIVDLSGTSTYTLDDGINDALTGQSAGMITVGPLANGTYSVTVSDEIHDCDDIVLTGSEDCFNCDLQVSTEANCVDNNGYNLDVTITGNGNYTISDDTQTLLNNQGAATITLDTLIVPDTDYTFYVISTIDATCGDTITVNNPCEICDLTIDDLTATCTDSENFTASVTIGGTSSYTISDGVHPNLTGQTAGTIDLGSFANGNYTVTVTDENVPDCSATQDFGEDCFDCDLGVTATEACINLTEYEVTLVVTGSGTFSINDGESISLTNQSAGTYVLGPLPSGAYSITVTSETDSDCVETVTGTLECFNCDLAGSVETTCIDVNTYNVELTLSGTGTYTIDDGLNNTLTGQSAGTFTFGSYNNGAYSIEVTSEVDEDCTQTFSGSNDCFECGLATSNVTTECIDLDNYEVTFELEGNGTYAIQYNGQTLTGQTAGTFTVGPFAEGAYSIQISSEQDLTCTETLTGEHTCFECDLVVSSVGTDCVEDTDAFEVSFTIAGTGTFTISDGVNADLTGQVAGNYTLGAYPEGNYSITITSETDATCTETIAGAKDCFVCDLEILTVNPICNDLATYNVLLNFSGEGQYTITNNSNITLINQSSGIFNIGPFPNGAYSISIFNEEDPTCQEVVSGVNECFECELPSFVTSNCIDDDTFEVIVTLEGEDAYTISYGSTTLTGQTAENVSAGPFTNGVYALTITSETDANCTQSYTGNLDCTPDIICDPSAVAIPECIDENSYNLNVTLGGTGTFTIEYNEVVLEGQTAGDIIIGPFNNGTYSLLIFNEADPSCQLPVSGDNDCTVLTPCDLAVTSSTVCAGNTGYNVELQLSGTGTFTIDDGVNEILTNQSEGLIILGPIPNGAYTIGIINEEDNECAIEVNGSDDCTFDCDLAVESFVNCVEGTGNFEVLVSIAGNSTYTVSDGVNPPLTGVTQGDVLVGPFSGATGEYEITITNEANSFCFQTISGNKFCDVPCDLELTLEEVNCGPDGLVDVTITIEGNSTYTINYGFFGDVITGATAGTYVLEGIIVEFDDFFNVFVQDEVDFTCSENISAAGVCDPSCNLTGDVGIECLEGGGFDLTITFDGDPDLGYDIFINLGFGALDTLLLDVAPGTYVFEGFSGDVYNVSITENDEIFEDCFLNFSGTTDCEPLAECDLETVISTNCVDENNFEIIVEIEGNSTYFLQITGGDFIEVFIEEENLTAGTYTFGPFPDGDNFFGYSIFIEDEINNTFECFEASFISRNCDVDCDFSVNYDVICNPNATFDIELTIEGESTYDVFSDFGLDQLINVTEGTYILGPYPNDFFFFFDVIDNQNPGCSQNVFGIADCDTNLECDLNANIGIECVEGEGAFIVEVSITGSDTYDIFNENDLVLEGVAEGAFFIGPFENGNFNISIINATNELCSQDFSGGFFCEPPPECDMQVDFTPTCTVDDSGYLIQIEIKGSSTYEIQRDGVPIATGFPSNIPVTVEGFSNEDPYNIVIIDENNPLCIQTFSGVFACSAPPICDLGLTATVVCLDDNSGGYNLELELTGSGSYFIETFVGIFLEGQTAGTIIVGPFFEDFYNVLVFKEDDEACSLSVFGTADCQPDFPACDVTVQLDINCIDNESYEVTMLIDGNSTYDIYEGLYVDLPGIPLLEDNVSPGSITVGPFDNGVYDLLIVDENNPTCYVDFIGARNCQNGGCDINAGVTTFCNPDSSSFNLILNLEGSSTYEVTIFQELGGPVVYQEDDVPAGSIEAGPIFGDEYYIFIQDEERPFCTQDFLGIKSCIVEEEPTCNLQLGATTECLPDGSGFNVILDLTGSGTYTIEDGFTGTIFGAEAGEIVLGPYPSGFFYNIFVQSEDNFTCFGGLNGFADCSEGVLCDLTTSAELTCIEGDTYTIDLTIGGTGTFNINSNLGDLNGVSAGTYTFGPAALNSYNFTVVNAANPDCQQSLSGTENCTDQVPPCDLTLTASTACMDNESYSISLNVGGTDTYTILSNGEPIQTGVTAGELEVGPFDSGSTYNIEVVNESDADCREGASGIRNCAVTTTCDLTATAETVCLDDSRYQIVVNFSGTEGDTYTINDGVNTPIPGQTGGEVIIGPLFNGEYLITISSETDPTCSLVINGTKDCTQELPCDIAITDVEVNCINENGYTVVVDFTGTGTFSLTDHEGSMMTGQDAGSYIFGPFANGDYFVTISSELTPDCELTFNGSRNCEPGGCDLLAIPETICTDNGDYLVQIELFGSSTYTLDDGIHPPTTNQASGNILMGPIPEGNYTIVITDEMDAACSITLQGAESCPSFLGTIGNIVFNDLDKNGLQDDEGKVVGLAGIEIKLISTTLGEVGTDISDADGFYAFENIQAGEYFLAFEIPEGYAASPQDVGLDDTIDSDINADGTTPVFTLAQGATLLNMDAGMYDNSECADFNAEVNESCPNGTTSAFYELAVVISGGTPPYTLDVGEYYFNDQLTPDDFPLPAITGIPNATTYTLIASDANGCQFTFNQFVDCVFTEVELLTFDGEVQDAGNLLQWVTGSEVNNDYFTLLRSTNGQTFEALTRVEGQGTTSETHAYAFLDREAPHGLSYYRLNQTDYDGTSTSSPVITLVRTEIAAFDIVQVAPIPTHDFLQLQFTQAQSGRVSVQLYDIVGREILLRQLNGKAGLNGITLSLEGYPTGTYLLVVSNGLDRKTVKVVKE